MPQRLCERPSVYISSASSFVCLSIVSAVCSGIEVLTGRLTYLRTFILHFPALSVVIHIFKSPERFYSSPIICVSVTFSLRVYKLNTSSPASGPTLTTTQFYSQLTTASALGSFGESTILSPIPQSYLYPSAFRLSMPSSLRTLLLQIRS